MLLLLCPYCSIEHELNIHKEASDLTKAVKQTLYEDYLNNSVSSIFISSLISIGFGIKHSICNEPNCPCNESEFIS